MLNSNNSQEFKGIKRIIERVNNLKNKVTDFVFIRRKSCESKKYSGGKIKKERLFTEGYDMREILYNYVTREIVSFHLRKTKEEIFKNFKGGVDIFRDDFSLKKLKRETGFDQEDEYKCDDYLYLKAKIFLKSHPMAERIVWRNIDPKFIDENIPKFVKKTIFINKKSEESEVIEDSDEEQNTLNVGRRKIRCQTRKKKKNVLRTVGLRGTFRKIGILAKFIGKTMKQANERKNRLGILGRRKERIQSSVGNRRRSASSVMIGSHLKLMEDDIEKFREGHSPDMKK